MCWHLCRMFFDEEVLQSIKFPKEKDVLLSRVRSFNIGQFEELKEELKKLSVVDNVFIKKVSQ